MTTDSPTGGETLEEWDGTAGTAVAYIRALEADRARLRAANHEGYSNLLAARADLEDARVEVGHLRAAITTPEVYYGVIAEEVADAYEKQGAELRQARADVARLTAERDEATQAALDWCVGSLPARYNDLRDGTRAEMLSFALYLYARSLIGSIASEKQRAEAAEARVARLEEALREILKLDYGFLAAKSIASHALTEGGDIESV